MSSRLPAAEHPLSPAAASRELHPDSLLDLFRALGDMTRLRILSLLRNMELAVGEIASLLDQSQPRVSRHVRLLEDAGFVVRRREGSWVFVRLARETQGADLLAVLATMVPSAAEQRVIDRDHNRLGAILKERDAAAQRFFAAHAHEWDRLRSLHVADAEVERAILALLGDRVLGHMLDIGTGTGRMVALLADHAERVTAVDRSPEMLRLARAQLSDVTAPVDLLQGEFVALPLADGVVNSAVMHLALHYAQAPERVIAEIARVLARDGIAIIVDFESHDREELRSEAAHARLGFSDAQMREWMSAAGLILDEVRTLSGGALTVKIWLGRRRRSARAPVAVEQNGKVEA